MPKTVDVWWPDGPARAKALVRFVVPSDAGHPIEVTAYRISIWEADTDAPVEPDAEANTLFAGVVKWDGCSHFNFGEGVTPEARSDGYLHLCGEGCFDVLAACLRLAWQHARALHPDSFMRELYPEGAPDAPVKEA